MIKLYHKYKYILLEYNLAILNFLPNPIISLLRIQVEKCTNKVSLDYRMLLSSQDR